MFTNSELSEIVLRVLKIAMIPGFLNTQSDCPFQLLGTLVQVTRQCALVLTSLCDFVGSMVVKKMCRLQNLCSAMCLVLHGVVTPRCAVLGVATGVTACDHAKTACDRGTVLLNCQ